MMPLSRITKREQIENVNQHIHDQYFSLSELSYEPTTRMLRIPFEAEDRSQAMGPWYQYFCKRWRFKVFKHVLEIQHVESHRIDDSANISSYTFDAINLTVNGRTLTISACEDLQIILEIDKLDIAIFRTNEYLGIRSVLAIFGCELSAQNWFEPAKRR
jgi:hypothetical protein